MLAPCPSMWTCVSSQDDNPAHFAPPWEYDQNRTAAFERLKSALQIEKGASIEYVSNDGSYLYVTFTSPIGIDDCEFFFTPNDNTIQFRSARRGTAAPWDANVNFSRLEALRKKCKFTNVDILRNRQRVFLFFESPFDRFGPLTEDTKYNLDIYDSIRTGGSDEKGRTQKFDLDPFAPAVSPLVAPKPSR
ncbi:hypothetical protein FVE85_6551 [Porphyridium purpureum]|uniref:Uncharacterized protein n=1 Tax=Porphyridium purpureum TaxID=35688 RepID=A0A5J4Z5L3_PORPP|nr:hypothetical protein FVE85_6551 [Porphyridium purpureum]|eukprot:POR6107..scf295_1